MGSGSAEVTLEIEASWDFWKGSVPADPDYPPTDCKRPPDRAEHVTGHGVGALGVRVERVEVRGKPAAPFD